MLLKHVVLQGTEEAVSMLTQAELTEYWTNSSIIFGRDPNEECTGGPIRRFQRLGPLKTIKISGPPDMFTWCECCDLPTTGLVGFDAVGLGPLLDC